MSVRFLTIGSVRLECSEDVISVRNIVNFPLSTSSARLVDTYYPANSIAVQKYGNEYKLIGSLKRCSTAMKFLLPESILCLVLPRDAEFERATEFYFLRDALNHEISQKEFIKKIFFNQHLRIFICESFGVNPRKPLPTELVLDLLDNQISQRTYFRWKTQLIEEFWNDTATSQNFMRYTEFTEKFKKYKKGIARRLNQRILAGESIRELYQMGTEFFERQLRKGRG